MERASQLLLNSKLGSKTGGETTVAQAAWRSAVGKRLAEVTHAAVFEKGTLKVYVEDKVWQAQLAPLKAQILAKMRKVTGGDLVHDLEFRVMPGRRGQARETQVVRDEASGISDPLLRRAFKEETGLKINEEQVRYVADLANLKLTPEEVARMAREMDQVLSHIDQLGELDTTGVEPMAQVLYPGADGLRADIEGATLPNAEVTANAAVSGAGFFKVPRVIER